MEPNESEVPEFRRNLGAQVWAIAETLKAAKDGKEGAHKADYIALARLDPTAEGPTMQQSAALTRVLHCAKVDCEHMSLSRWRCWANIAHGIAITAHCALDSATPRLGQQLAKANVSEARVMRLLNARGDAFFQAFPRVIRLMASRGVAPNWTEFGRLILDEGARDPCRKLRAETARLNIVRKYTQAKTKSDRKQ